MGQVASFVILVCGNMRLPSYLYHVLLWNAKRLCGMQVKKAPPKLNLDSLLYRMVWNTKRVCGVRNRGPHPVVWRKFPYRTYVPPMEWQQSLDDSQRARLEIVQKELEVLARIYTYIPDQIAAKEWQELIKMNSVKERFQHLDFIRKKERMKAKAHNEKMNRERSDAEVGETDIDRPLCSTMPEDQEEKQEEKEESEDVDEVPEADYGHPYKLFLRRTCNKRAQESDRYLTSLRLDDTPKVAIDCRFLGQHSRRGLNLTMIQLHILIVSNSCRKEPWPVFLTNFDETNSDISKLKQSKLRQLDAKLSLKADLTSQSYLDLFPEKRQQDKIIYLSPHAEQDLEHVESDTCYVIGGIVDRAAEPGIVNQASRVVAEQEGLQCKKLPLDQHLEWQNGNKMLTLTAVLAILQDVYDSNGDWRYALLKNIPVRKLRKPDEINQSVKLRNQEKKEYQKEVLRVLTENSTP